MSNSINPAKDQRDALAKLLREMLNQRNATMRDLLFFAQRKAPSWLRDVRQVIAEIDRQGNEPKGGGLLGATARQMIRDARRTRP